jgi:hypothetical protein
LFLRLKTCLDVFTTTSIFLCPTSSYFVKAYDVAFIYTDDYGYLVRYAGHMPAAFLDRDDVVRYLQRCFETMKRLPFYK